MFDYLWIFFGDRNETQRKLKYELLKKARKGDVVAMGKLAKISMESRDEQTAIKWYKKLLDLGGKNARAASNNLGNIFYSKKNFNQAIDYYYRAANEGLTVAKKNLGILYQDIENWELAIGWLEAAAYDGDLAAKKRLERLRLRPTNMPIYSWQEAERLAQKWMFYFGYHDSKLTRAGADGGIDVNSSRAVAQVKYENTKTGRPVIQALAGEAHNQGKEALFFSLSGYTKGATEWAEESRIGVALFQYDQSGNIECSNSASRQIMKIAKSR